MVRHHPNFLIIVLLIIAGVIVTHVGQVVLSSNGPTSSGTPTQAYSNFR